MLAISYTEPGNITTIPQYARMRTGGLSRFGEEVGITIDSSPLRLRLRSVAAPTQPTAMSVTVIKFEHSAEFLLGPLITDPSMRLGATRLAQKWNLRMMKSSSDPLLL